MDAAKDMAVSSEEVAASLQQGACQHMCIVTAGRILDCTADTALAVLGYAMY
jgi:hypothetical protein